MNEHKLSKDLQLLFNSILKNPSQQTVEELMAFSNRVFNSLIGSQPIQQTLLKQKCLERASSIYNGDSKNILKCQEFLQKVSTSTSLKQKSGAIRVLLKIAEAQSLSVSTVSVQSNFQSQMSKKHQMNVTSNTLRSEDFRDRQTILPEKLSIIRIRGSPEQSASQNEILRELLFSMQNIQGNLIQYNRDIPATLKPYLNVSEPVRKIVMEISEIGWLYKKATAKSFDTGEIIQSFSLAIEYQLAEFYRWVAIIQSLLLENSLTLRKLVTWSIQPLERMKWLAILSEAVFPFRGTQIISIINSYRPHGNTHLMELFNRMLIHVIQPLFQFIQLWVCRGQLFDPHNEFFIREEPKTGSENFWERKYALIEKNVPNVTGMDNAKIVFNIGKTINFLKHCCGQEFQLKIDFLDKELILDSKCTATTFSYMFTEWLYECQTVVNRELMRVLFDKFKLNKHLDAIKRFLLMGQGDFIDQLLDILGEQLNKTPINIYKHNLNNLLEKALTSSNAQYLQKDITGRVNVEMLQGPDGWDNFILTYYVDEPINTLLTPKIMKEGYLGIFGFLWKLKRVERAVNIIWTNHIKEISRKTFKQEVKSEAAQRTKKYFKRFENLFIECSLLRSSMQHFISSLYSYIILKIQAAWGNFNLALETTTRFDEVIKLHESLVVQLRQICFLQPKTKSIQHAIFSLFQQIFNFKHRQDSLIQVYHNFKEQARQAILSQRAMMRLQKLDMKQQINIPLGLDQNSTKDLIHESSKKISQSREHFIKILGQLMYQLEKEGEKYSVLCLKQDFNEFYKLLSIPGMTK